MKNITVFLKENSSCKQNIKILDAKLPFIMALLLLLMYN